jgi:hypothetical protein
MTPGLCVKAPYPTAAVGATPASLCAISGEEAMAQNMMLLRITRCIADMLSALESGLSGICFLLKTDILRT